MSTCELRTEYSDGSECGQPALYRVFGVDCYKCCDFGGCEFCMGHMVCGEHAARLRTDSVAQVKAGKKDVPAFTVERIYSLASAG
jgi:hypothetical protein